MNENMSGIFIFFLIFNILFSAFSYALTVFPDAANPDYEISIDQDRIIEYGVSFTNATSVNITFGGGYEYFTYNDRNLRTQWLDGAAGADYIVFEKRTWLGEKLDSWLFYMDLSIELTDENFVTNALYNGTIINYWDTDNDWLRMDIDHGVVGFLSTLPADAGNITQAVQVTGILTLTIGEIDTTLELDAGEFIDWYTATILGTNYNGLPSALNWIIRGMLTLNIVIAIFMIRDLTKI